MYLIDVILPFNSRFIVGNLNGIILASSSSYILSYLLFNFLNPAVII